MAKYSSQDKEHFWRVLEAYRKALESGVDIIGASIRIHVALGDVPKSYKSYVHQVFNSACSKREG